MPQLAPLFRRSSWPEASRVAVLLRGETLGGGLLLVAAAVALVVANSGWAESYTDLRDLRLGPSALHLNLSVGSWASDGLLAIFFFVAGLELKREFVAGDLRDVRRAIVPVAAAAGGMVVPVAVYLLTNAAGDGSSRGWAVPTATDIAFALAVLAVIGSHLPSALRTFLLTLAVVDDLLAICIIAIFFTRDLQIIWLAAALLPLGCFALAVRRRIRSWWILLPLALITWVLVHASGVHATVAGVLLAFTVPVHRSAAAGGPDAGPGLAEHFEHRWRPLSAGVAVPLFALFAAGVPIGEAGGLGSVLTDPVSLGVVLGLVVGKPLGICLTTFVVGRLTGARLPRYLSWWDVLGLGLLGGIGFTVSLLIGELAFADSQAGTAAVKFAVLLGSVLSALLAAVVLVFRNRVHRQIARDEERDDDNDGIPDVYQRDEQAD